MNKRLDIVSLFTPLILIGGVVMAMGYVHPLPAADTLTMQASDCIAPQLQSPRYAPVWAITLRRQYASTQTCRQALRSAPTLAARIALEQRYHKVAVEYNRMAQEAPSLAFRSLPLPRILPE